MSYRRLVRLAVSCVCVLFNISWAHAQILQAPASAELQIVIRSDSGPIPRAQVIVGGNTTLKAE